jgi:hypothetical protein
VPDAQPLRRTGYVLVAATVLAVGGCGPAGGPVRADGPPNPLTTRPPAASTPVTRQPATDWKPACTLLTDAAVLAATDGHDTKISITDHLAEETATDSNGRVSSCTYNLLGARDNETVGGASIVFRVEEWGAYIYFPPHMGEETVGGLGDAAFWADGPSARLNVRAADRLYVWTVELPLIQGPPPEESARIERTVALALARGVLAKR